MTKDEKDIHFSSENRKNFVDTTNQSNQQDGRESEKSSDSNISLEELFLRA